MAVAPNVLLGARGVQRHAARPAGRTVTSSGSTRETGAWVADRRPRRSRPTALRRDLGAATSPAACRRARRSLAAGPTRRRRRSARRAARGVADGLPAGERHWFGPGFYGRRTACGQRMTKHAARRRAQAPAVRDDGRVHLQGPQRSPCRSSIAARSPRDAHGTSLAAAQALGFAPPGASAPSARLTALSPPRGSRRAGCRARSAPAPAARARAAGRRASARSARRARAPRRA